MDGVIQDENELFKSFSKQVKNKIKKALTSNLGEIKETSLRALKIELPFPLYTTPCAPEDSGLSPLLLEAFEISTLTSYFSSSFRPPYSENQLSQRPLFTLSVCSMLAARTSLSVNT